MGVLIRTLTSLDDYDKDRIKDGDAYGLIEDLKSEILEYYYREIEYFKDVEPDLSDDSDNFVLGSSQPEKLIAEASKWNDSVKASAIENFKKLEEKAKENGFDSISTFLESKSVHEIYKLNDLYSLGHDALSLQGMWQYGEYHMVFDTDKGLNKRSDCGNDCNYYGNSTLIGDNLLSDIKAHPEDYLIVDLICD